MDFITKLAKGLAAARNAVGSEELAPQRALALEAGGSLNLQPRRKRETGLRVIRIETPLGEGLARIDLSAADARALADELIAFANTAADEAKPVTQVGAQVRADD
jgi:hypothetical protein